MDMCVPIISLVVLSDWLLAVPSGVRTRSCPTRNMRCKSRNSTTSHPASTAGLASWSSGLILSFIQVGVRGTSCVVLGVEKKSTLQLQDPRTVRKVAMLDDHVCVAFAGGSLALSTPDLFWWRGGTPEIHTESVDAGLTADGRILIDKARVECQSHRLTVEDPVSIEYITKHIAGIQQVCHYPSHYLHDD